ncbi:MAG: HEPN domain-containing protein [Rubrobacter sp.]|nr:HEPN domain-containing protein [Rubrobacter sp.]
MSDEVGQLLDKARRAFDAAGLLLEADHEDFAASQAYYGFFYIAEALLLSKGLRFNRHGQIVGQYGRLFAKTGELDPRYHRLLIETFEVRQTATYDAANDGPTEEEVAGYIHEGRAFLEDARSHIS